MSLKRLGKGVQLKPTTLLDFFLWLVKSLKNLQIIELLITWRNVALFLISSGFRSSRSTADLLAVVSEKIARNFNRSGANWAVALDISKAFDRVWHVGILNKLKCYRVSGQMFRFISSFLSNKQLRVVLYGKSSQEYPVNAGVSQGSIFGPPLFVQYINNLVDDVICDIASMLVILLSILSVITYPICGNNLNWLLNLNLI